MKLLDTDLEFKPELEESYDCFKVSDVVVYPSAENNFDLLETYCVFGDEYCNESFIESKSRFWISVQIDRIKLFIKNFIFKNLPLNIYSKIYPPKNGVQS
jgi:hypothetical protein